MSKMKKGAIVYLAWDNIYTLKTTLKERLEVQKVSRKWIVLNDSTLLKREAIKPGEYLGLNQTVIHYAYQLETPELLEQWNNQQDGKNGI